MRHIVLLIVTLILCAVVVFSLGAYPHFWNHLLGRQDQDTVVFMVSDRSGLPEDLPEKFFRETGLTLQLWEVKTPNLFLSEARNADLLYAPWEWLSSQQDNLHTWTDQLLSQLFADFQSTDIFAQKFFPLFWSLQPEEGKAKKQFHFEGLATLKVPSEETKTFIGFLIHHEEILKEWTRQKGLGSTLQKATLWSDLSASLKPQAVREYPLAEISVKKTSEKEQ
jgi:hypothetical protein